MSCPYCDGTAMILCLRSDGKSFCCWRAQQDYDTKGKDALMDSAINAKELIVKSGVYYVTREGFKCQCVFVGIRDAIFEFENGDMMCRNKKGRLSEDYFSVGDIVEEWKEAPIVDWSLYAKWHKWMAKDKDDCWFVFWSKPYAGHTRYASNDGMYEQIPSEYSPQFTGDWKDSLIERPQSIVGDKI